MIPVEKDEYELLDIILSQEKIAERGTSPPSSSQKQTNKNDALLVLKCS